AQGGEHSALQQAALERARSARAELLQLAEDDAVAYGAFMEALKLPKSSDDERAARTSAISAAAQRAAEVPLATLRATVAVAEAARSIQDKSLLAAASDLEVAARFARASGESAAENVEANLPYIDDPQTRAEIASQTSAALTALHRATPRALLQRQLRRATEGQQCSLQSLQQKRLMRSCTWSSCSSKQRLLVLR
ncbi:MAG: cyclodeaminase/cyclohydrolase family protein, partial [Chloroflexi bacterium]|nr:cyclodeaminase/cyclohydrolase family protein [Chloroflexota bacterium]